jgi:hypothetical protein
MAANGHLYHDPDAVHGTGSRLTAASPSQGGGSPVRPCAADQVSVAAAAAIAMAIAELNREAGVLDSRRDRAGSLLSSSAAAYTEQEALNAAALSDRAELSSTATPAGMVAPAGLLSVVPDLGFAAPAGSGVVPSTGKQIAALLHGGPGPDSLDAAARALGMQATQLDSASGMLRSTRAATQQSWASTAADRADHHLSELEASYGRSADRARALARSAADQATAFRQARSATPTPQHFTDLERRLHAAATANAAPGSMGLYTATVAKLQTELAAANQQAMQSYSTYTTHSRSLPLPGHTPNPATTTPAAPAAPGTPAPAGPPHPQTDPQPSHRTPAESGPHPEIPGGPTGSEGAPGPGPRGDETNTAGELAPGDPTGISDLGQSVIPAVLGAVAGIGGGVFGALSGAAGKVQQTGTQLVSGLAQSGASALQGLGTTAPNLGVGDQNPAGSDMGAGDDAGGPVPGDVEAASAGGPLASGPASAVAAPAVAAAPTFASGGSSGTIAAPVGAGGMPMGGMMPPMMGGPGRGGGAGNDDDRLYEQKRLRLETAPNAEPVRGRREARETRSERRD